MPASLFIGSWKLDPMDNAAVGFADPTLELPVLTVAKSYVCGYHFVESTTPSVVIHNLSGGRCLHMKL